MKRFASFREFYPYYLSEHGHRTSRRLHFVGSCGVLAFIALVSLVLLAATTWQAVQARDVQLHNAQISVSNLASSIDRQAVDAIQQADNVLVELAEPVDGLHPR